MLRHLKPKRYVEVGSGFSSACALDTAERFLDDLQLTFFEPNPQRLHRLIRPSDNVRLVDRVPTRYTIRDFAEIEPGDVVFIDSSHVVKYGSEVNDLLLDVVPQLPVGVHVHIHDIFWPFTYPLNWVTHRKAWNEGYLLRALLCNNASLRINWFNNFLGHVALDEVGRTMPAWRADPGSSIWLERV